MAASPPFFRRWYSRIVIPSGAEGSFSFAIFCFMCESVCMKHRSSGAQGVRCFPLADPLTYFALTANEKDFSLSLEMTNAGKRHFRIESHLHVELVKWHSPSFPWKEVPRRGGGWHRRGLKSRAGGALSRIVIPSAAEGSFSFAIFCFMRESVCMKHRSSGAQGVRCFPLAVPLTSFALPRKKKISRFRSK